MMNKGAVPLERVEDKNVRLSANEARQGKGFKLHTDSNGTHKTLANITGDRIKISMRAPGGRLSLRVREQNRLQTSEALRVPLPLQIGKRKTDGKRSVLCLGPDEWVIRTPCEDVQALLQKSELLRDATPHSLVDVSSRDVEIDISGRDVEAVLSAGCPIDFRQFSVGEGKRTIFDSVQIILDRHTDTDFSIEVWRSYSAYIWEGLALAIDDVNAESFLAE
ncbi:MAG: sarcosine oxidase subunit gamma family protein [Pseudomonadota bacterium]